jgi:NAD(P)-dependent dehydrogenase (short-subunit alcohol dehydrogenase family)
MSSGVGRTALIIGASRGLGLALTREFLGRGWGVIATRRGASPGLEALARDAGGRLEIETLEMTDRTAARALEARLAGRVLDLLLVNGAVANGAGERLDQVSDDEFVRVMVTNTLSPMRLIEALGGLVRKGGVIAAMTSRLGSVALNETGGWEVYRASKAALNTLMRSYAVRHQADGHSLAVVHPGWVRTEMGGAGATLAIEESIPGLATTLEGLMGKPGMRFVDYRGETLPW